MANYFDYDYLSELVQDADPAGVPVAVNLFLHKQDDWPHKEIPYIIVVAPGKGRRTLRWYWKVEDIGSGIIEGYLYRMYLKPLWERSTSGNLENQWLAVVRYYIQNHNLIARAALPTNPLEKITQPSCWIDDLGYQCMEVIVAYRVLENHNKSQDDPGHWVYAPIRQRQVVPSDTDPDNNEKYLYPGEVRLTDKKAIAALIVEEKRKREEDSKRFKLE